MRLYRDQKYGATTENRTYNCMLVSSILSSCITRETFIFFKISHSNLQKVAQYNFFLFPKIKIRPQTAPSVGSSKDADSIFCRRVSPSLIKKKVKGVLVMILNHLKLKLVSKLLRVWSTATLLLEFHYLIE